MARMRITRDKDGQPDIQQVDTGERRLSPQEKARIDRRAQREARAAQKRSAADAAELDALEQEIEDEEDDEATNLATAYALIAGALKISVAEVKARLEAPKPDISPAPDGGEPEDEDEPDDEEDTEGKGDDAEPGTDEKSEAPKPAAEPKPKKARGKRVPCPHCEFTAAGPGGLSSHIRAQHPAEAK